MRRHVLLLCVVSLWLCPQVRGYFANVDAHAEECFFDRVSSGMKMSLTFEVVEGGFLDIDVKVGDMYYIPYRVVSKTCKLHITVAVRLCGAKSFWCALIGKTAWFPPVTLTGNW